MSVAPCVTAKDGKQYSHLACTVVANDEKDAARIANEKDSYGVHWSDIEIFDCSPAAFSGVMPAYGWCSVNAKPA